LENYLITKEARKMDDKEIRTTNPEVAPEADKIAETAGDRYTRMELTRMELKCPGSCHEGEVKIRDENGKTVHALVFDHKGRLALEHFYDEEGNIVLERRYHSNGRIWERNEYKNDDIVKHEEWDEDGHLVGLTEYDEKGREVVHYRWHPNGQLQTKMDFHKGHRILEREWDENGNLKVETERDEHGNIVYHCDIEKMRHHSLYRIRSLLSELLKTCYDATEKANVEEEDKEDNKKREEGG